MKTLIVANWKMNPVSLAEAKKLFNTVKEGIKDVKNVEVVICPPFVYLSSLNVRGETSNIKLGAQDCFWEEKGAFTGEVSPRQLKDLGVEYVIIGHSERRKYFNETDKIVNKKLKACLKEGIKPILCIEKLSQLKGVKRNIIVAFEPVSAIGTGKAFGIEKAKSVRKTIRNKLVLYGGSVNSQNTKDYIEKAGFKGLLVGGASLKPKEFIKIVKSVDF
jgi:triosephosphate isomerase